MSINIEDTSISKEALLETMHKHCGIVTFFATKERIEIIPKEDQKYIVST